MIKLVGKAPISQRYAHSSWAEFKRWESSLTEFQLDLESNVVDSIVERVLITVQLGDVYGETQWVIQWSYLTEEQKRELKQILENQHKQKLIHNAVFEYTLLYKYGIIINNVYDTMLVEKVISTGWRVEKGYYALAGLMKRYFHVEMSKEEQTTFGDDILTESKVIYAADDVKSLGFIRRVQLDRVKECGLENVVALENEAVLAFSEIEYYGMLLDQVAWRDNVAKAQPVIDDARELLESYVNTELRAPALRMGYLNANDTINFNWGAPKQRQKVLMHLFDGLEGATQPIVKKYIKTHGEGLSPMQEYLLQLYLHKQYDELNEILVALHRDWLIEQDMIIPANTVTLNWNSPPQRLRLFKIVEPQLKSTKKDALADCDHPIIEAYQEYINYTKLLSSFGEKFIQQYVDPDGRVRTRFNQILTTGRVSSSSPNMQNIPAKETVGNRYRNCFVEEPGWVFVDSDYKSQELVVIASMSNDPVWMKALREDKDLHSVCAELVFGQKWKDAADPDCAFYKQDDKGELLKEKCKCKKHKTQRTNVKTINFGLAYGMSKFKLSGTAKITVEEAAELIEAYFKAFPSIGGLLNNLGRFGTLTGYIMTPAPFKRRRWFDYWEKKKHDDYWMGKIERASKNQPIQGCSADITKLAMIMIRWYIHDNNLQDKVRIVAQVHDQVTTTCKAEYAETWKPIFDGLMCAAAKFIIPNGLLTADTNITDKWSK